MAKDKNYNYVARYASDYDGVAHEWMYNWMDKSYKGRTSESYGTVRMSFRGNIAISYTTEIAHRLDSNTIVYYDYKSTTTQKQLYSIRHARPAGVEMLVVPRVRSYYTKQDYVKQLEEYLHELLKSNTKRNKFGALPKAKDRDEFWKYSHSLFVLGDKLPKEVSIMRDAINECEVALKERYEEQREKREAQQAERIRIEQRSFDACLQDAKDNLSSVEWDIISNVNTWKQYNKASELLKPFMSKADRENVIETAILHYGRRPNPDTLGCSIWNQVLFVLFEDDTCEKVRTSGGVIMPTKHALILAEMVRYSPDEVKGRHIGQFVVEAIDDNHVKVGCHVLERVQLEKLYDYRASLLPEEK